MIFEKLPTQKFSNLWTVKLGGVKWDVPLLVVHLAVDVENEPGNVKCFPRGRVDRTMIGELIGDTNVSYLKSLLSNDTSVEIIEMNPELFNYTKAKCHLTDNANGIIDWLKQCAQERRPWKCIDIMHDFIKKQHKDYREQTSRLATIEIMGK